MRLTHNVIVIPHQGVELEIATRRKEVCVMLTPPPLYQTDIPISLSNTKRGQNLWDFWSTFLGVSMKIAMQNYQVNRQKKCCKR